MAATDTPAFTWAGIDPAEWLRAWQTLWRLAPENLAQPILPGWTFNINSNNSSAPQTEADVLAKHSYGRQLGRIADALELLIVEQHGETPADARYGDFLQMKREIDAVKQASAAARIEQLRRDLEVLRTKNRPEYERLRNALRAVLGA
jgi:hypothetical protein